MEEGNNEVRRRRRRPRRRGRGGGGRGSGGGEKGANGNSAENPDQGAENASGQEARDASNGGGERAQSGNGGNAGRGQNRRGRKKGGRGRRQQSRGNGQRGGPRRRRTGENWWARRWVEVLEKFAVGRRLGRGRNYARQGNITDIEIGKGSVIAHVQGSRDAPYLVRMHFSMLSSTDWKKLCRALAQRPEIAVELGAGNIPDTIEAVFEEQQLSLFPNAVGDLKAACSCPDKANPCKHVAAVYYLIGEEFDRDPFLIFQLRGMERSELLAALGPAAIPKPPAPPPPPPEFFEGAGELGEDGEELLDAPPPIPQVIEAPPEREIPDEPLPEDPEIFWGGAVRPTDEEIEVRIPRTPGAVVARLGGFPFWRGQSNCEAAMARIYRNASITGLDVYLASGAVDEGGES